MKVRQNALARFLAMGIAFGFNAGVCPAGLWAPPLGA